METLNARKDRRGSQEQDVEAVLDELYTTAPSAFVTRRETLAAAARTAGRVDDARRIHAARRPTLAAWAANLLLRSQPEESRQFLELGRALREAYRALEAESLKKLSAQRRRVVSALSRQAVQLAREAGERLSEPVQQDLEATLRAVLADPDAADQWAGGRLVNALTPPSEFGPAAAAAAETPGTRNRPAASPPSARASKDELAERRRARQAQLARAKEAAEAAEQAVREERARQADADGELQRARERTEQARGRMAAIEEQLQQAREECRQAENAQQQAEEHSRSAADALARAERTARESAQHVRRLTAGTT